MKNIVVSGMLALTLAGLTVACGKAGQVSHSEDSAKDSVEISTETVTDQSPGGEESSLPDESLADVRVSDEAAGRRNRFVIYCPDETLPEIFEACYPGYELVDASASDVGASLPGEAEVSSNEDALLIGGADQSSDDGASLSGGSDQSSDDGTSLPSGAKQFSNQDTSLTNDTDQSPDERASLSDGADSSPDEDLTVDADTDDGVKVMDGKVGDMQIHWVITDYLSDLENSNDLDELLVAQQAEGASEYDWVDLFVVNELNLEKYIGDGVDVAMDLKSLGISKRQMQQQLPYTRILGSDGRKQRGASIDISPGVFLYRRSIANAVFGTDDPDIVGASVADWDAFQMTVEKVGSAGYKMLAGYDAAFDAFAESVKDGWYSDEGSVVIDDHLMDWVEMTKKFAEDGLCGDSEMGSEAWLKELTGKGDVFGYFLSAEEIGRLKSDYIDEDADSYGDWGIVAGPAGWYRGGTFLCAAVGTPNPEFAAEIIRNLTCNEEVMQEIYEETGLTVNNRKVLLGMASDEAYESGAGIFRDYDLPESSEEENRQESQHDLSDSAGKAEEGDRQEPQDKLSDSAGKSGEGDWQEQQDNLPDSAGQAGEETCQESQGVFPDSSVEPVGRTEEKPGDPFLGGQHSGPVYLEAAERVEDPVADWDKWVLDDIYEEAYYPYFRGECSANDALASFYQKAKDLLIMEDEDEEW